MIDHVKTCSPAFLVALALVLVIIDAALMIVLWAVR